MRKAETLRGRGAFSELIGRGERIEGELLRCFHCRGGEARVPIVVGFAVSGRLHRAVRRNRIRRLMRAAFDVERERVVAVLESSRTSLRMVFMFKGKKEVDRLDFHPIHRDMADIFRRLLARL